MAKKRLDQNDNHTQDLEGNVLADEQRNFEQEYDESVEGHDSEKSALKDEESFEGVDQQRDDQEDVFEELDFDFWEEVFTSYGEISSKQELNLILQKLKLELKQEQQKTKKIHKMVVTKNKTLRNKTKQQRKVQNRLLRTLPTQKKLQLKQQAIEEKAKIVQLKVLEKQEEKQFKAEKKQLIFEQKNFDSEFNRQEKIAILSMVATEKKEYLFQRNAKNKIESLNQKIEEEMQKQLETKDSDELPITDFLYFLLGCVAITVIIVFCCTNIYVDKKYYSEKMVELEKSIASYDQKLDGDMVTGLNNIHTAIATYENIIGVESEMRNKLDALNNKYKWVLLKETPESTGIITVEQKADDIKEEVDVVKQAINNRTSLIDDINSVFESDKQIEEIKEMLIPYGEQIDQVKAGFEVLDFPVGIDEHKESYLEELDQDRTYYDKVIAYLDECILLREDIGDVQEDIADAMQYEPSRSYSYKEQVDGYYEKMKSAEILDRAIINLNNTVDYAMILNKKTFASIAAPEVTDEQAEFFNLMTQLDEISNINIYLENKCLNLPYPSREKTGDEKIIKYMTQKISDDMLEDNADLKAKLLPIQANVPSRMTDNVAYFLEGLDKRTEFINFQKKYLELEQQKNDFFLKIIEAENNYAAAYNTAKTYRDQYGKTDEYIALRDEYNRMEDLIDVAEDTAKDMAEEIRDEQKQVREQALSIRDDYEEDLGF